MVEGPAEDLVHLERRISYLENQLASSRKVAPSPWTPRIATGVAALALLVSLILGLYNGFIQQAALTNTANSAVVNICFQWARYVDDAHARGVPLKEIDRRGRWFTNYVVDEATDNDTITDGCGTAAGILEGTGKPPTQKLP